MDLKQAIFKVVIANLSNSTIKKIYDKAVQLSTQYIDDDSSYTLYIRVYSYSSFSRYIKTKISSQVFDTITSGCFIDIPVTGYGNDLSIGYYIKEVDGSTQYMTDFVTKPNLDTYNRLMDYERQMLDSNTP